MPRELRRARVRALAKINLNLEVLHRRPDGYHEIRTLFHTVSLADRLDLEFTRGARTRILTESSVEIPDNLAERAAALLIEETRAPGELRIRLRKRIPIGSGLGGGSSDAAAVLLALPALTGRAPSFPRLLELAASLGSDVPFFLIGGCVLGLGRGEQLYPLPQAPRAAILLVDPGIPVSTGGAYRALGRSLTSTTPSPKINSSQRLSLGMGEGLSASAALVASENDFEEAVFREHPRLESIQRRLKRLGANPARLSGSGAAIFGVFDSRGDRNRAMERLDEKTFPVSLVSRAAYRRLWFRSLREHIQDEESWPPRSRYAR